MCVVSCLLFALRCLIAVLDRSLRFALKFCLLVIGWCSPIVVRCSLLVVCVFQFGDCRLPCVFCLLFVVVCVSLLTARCVLFVVVRCSLLFAVCCCVLIAICYNFFVAHCLLYLLMSVVAY